jgi:ABC-2 type transport system permease protein
MTLLGPLLFAALMLAPYLINKYSQDNIYRILIVDEAPTIFTTILPSSERIQFINDTLTLAQAKKKFNPDKYYGILYLPADIVKNPGASILYTEKQTNLEVKSTIEDLLQKYIETAKLKSYGIKQETLESIKTRFSLSTLTLSGKHNSAELNTAVGMFAGILIYMFIILYGVQVMRGVIEEKTNRIVEVIISSVKPFQLMMGKIVGIAMVGLTQFLLWIGLTLLFSSAITNYVIDQKTDPQKITHIVSDRVQSGSTGHQQMMQKQMEKGVFDSMVENAGSINFTLIIVCFLIYFLGGYLLYSALFAAIGAAVDSETETQQFMLPVTIPLILSFIVAQTIITNPESQIGFWFSIIPFTSPVVMMVRIAFGVPPTELYLSIGLLILGFLGTTWLAAKIYRTGILLYGKKVSFKELSKWIFYKD